MGDSGRFQYTETIVVVSIFRFPLILYFVDVFYISCKIEAAIDNKSIVVTAIVHTVRSKTVGHEKHIAMNKHFATAISKLYKIEGDKVFKESFKTLTRL